MPEHGLLLQSLCISSIHGGHKSGMTRFIPALRHSGAGRNPIIGTYSKRVIPTARKKTIQLDAGAWIAPAILMHFLHPWRSQVRHDEVYSGPASFRRRPESNHSKVSHGNLSFISSRSGFSDDSIFDLADTLDRDPHSITGAQKFRRIKADANSGRRAGRDNVAR